MAADHVTPFKRPRNTGFSNENSLETKALQRAEWVWGEELAALEEESRYHPERVMGFIILAFCGAFIGGLFVLYGAPFIEKVLFAFYDFVFGLKLGV